MARRKRRKKKGFFGRSFDRWDILIISLMLGSAIIVFSTSESIWAFVCYVAGVVFAITVLSLFLRKVIKKVGR